MTKQTKRRSVRKLRRNKSTKKIRTQKKVGGNKGEFKSLLLSLLNDKYIPFLPSTVAIKDPDQSKNYLNCVSAFQLLSIIGKNKKYSMSKD